MALAHSISAERKLAALPLPRRPQKTPSSRPQQANAFALPIHSDESVGLRSGETSPPSRTPRPTIRAAPLHFFPFEFPPSYFFFPAFFSVDSFFSSFFSAAVLSFGASFFSPLSPSLFSDVPPSFAGLFPA